MAGSLERFLQRNSIVSSKSLPLVRTTSAYSISKILKDQKITPVKCDVFKSEMLSYFFVGRPAYKRDYHSEVEYWQLPSCIVLNYDKLSPKRIFPFDSGAFQKGVLPEFITMMDLEEFSAAPVKDSIEKIIGSFFVDPSNYYRLKPRSVRDFEKRFSVEMLDQEIKDLYKLILSKSAKYDDRRFAIELQLDKVLPLVRGSMSAAVFPEEYCESDEFMSYIEDNLGAEPLPYQTFPLKAEFYYHAIYDKLFEFYKSKKWIR